MKILYHDLQIEITRRCTGDCKHCCRGDQQNLDLTKEEIDALLNYNDIHSVNRLLFSGGNPPLNGEMLE